MKRMKRMKRMKCMKCMKCMKRMKQAWRRHSDPATGMRQVARQTEFDANPLAGLCNATAKHDLSVKRVLRRSAGTITWR